MQTFATLDEELAFMVTQIKQARAEGPSVDSLRPAPDEIDTRERTRRHFPRGTETLSDGYLNRLSFREPSPSNGDDSIGREYRRGRRYL